MKHQSNNHYQNRPGEFNNRNYRNNQNKKQKNKIDKRDLPENNRFYCEVCDRGFKTDEKYQEHLGTHTTVKKNFLIFCYFLIFFTVWSQWM